MGPGITGMLCTHAVVSAVFFPTAKVHTDAQVFGNCRMCFSSRTFVFVWYITTCLWYVHLCTIHDAIVMREIPFYQEVRYLYVDQDRMGMLICWLLGVCMWRGLVCGGRVGGWVCGGGLAYFRSLE